MNQTSQVVLREVYLRKCLKRIENELFGSETFPQSEHQIESKIYLLDRYEKITLDLAQLVKT